MAAAAHVERNLTVAAADDMDLHSDSGLDFGDGDIELDFDPEPQDDDISIKDAETDAGIDAHADQDDFMADNEAPVDEDTVLYDDEVQADTTPVNNATAVQVQAPAPEDEDLIDYSDEEEEPTSTHQPTSFYTPIDSYRITENDLVTQAKDNQGDVASACGDFGAHDQAPDQNGSVGNAIEERHEYVRKSEIQDEASDHTDGEEGGVQLQHDVEPQTNTNEDKNDGEQEENSYESRTITVNYEGNELWLFKQHDTDNSGDWLMEDMSVLQSSLSDLFRACRASLGEDITHETELGFRFDHLQNMEIYEDNTACVAVSLERLIDLYHTLNAQDGVHEPDSFYMCLLSRPRFATLLSDVAKHAELGSGYSGLNAAIAAGETHFAGPFSGPSTEYEGVEWDNEEEEQAQHDSTASNGIAGQEAEHTEHEEESYENGTDGEEHSNQASPEHANGPTSEDATQVEQVVTEGYASPPKADHSEKSAQQDQVEDVTAQQEPEPLTKAQQEQIDNDTIDYSDAEDDEGPQTKVHDALSPSSATVQGDDPATGDAQNQTTDPTGDDAEQHSGQGNTVGDAANAVDVQTHLEEQLGHEESTESYQDYAEEYNQDDTYEEFQLGTTDNYTEEPSFESYTNQDSAGYDYQNLDQQLQNDFISGTDFDGTGFGDSADVTNNFTEGDDFLDLDNPGEWVPDEETLSKVAAADTLEVTAQNEEEEDGVVKQPVAATSTTADPVAASSTDLQESSPQGQKRSIDEVSDSVGDAIDLTDMKRPRV